jgi:hypothetical protein
VVVVVVISLLSARLMLQVGDFVFTAGYVGDSGRELGNGVNQDAPPLTNSPNYVSMEPFYSYFGSNVNQISEEASNDTSSYNALQMVANFLSDRGAGNSLRFAIAMSLFLSFSRFRALESISTSTPKGAETNEVTGRG